MKKVLLIILAVVFLFSAYSCKGTGSETTDTMPDTTKSGDYKPFKYGIKAADYIKALPAGNMTWPIFQMHVFQLRQA